MPFLPPLWAGSATVREHLPFLRCRNELAKLMLMASPIVAIGLLNMAMSIIDIVMLGRHDATGLAGVVIISDLYSIIFNFSAGFAGLVTPRVAAAIGAGVRWHVCTIVRRTLVLVLLLGLAGAAIIFSAAAFLDAMGVTRSEAARSYAALMAGTYLFMLLFTLCRIVLSAVGRPRFALFAIVAALPLKVAANAIFIYGAWGLPPLGVTGVGLASLAVAVLMGCSLLVYLFVSPSFGEFDDPEPVPFTFAELWQLTRSGTLMGLIAVSETGVFLISTILIGFLAPQELVAHTLAFRSMALCYLIVVGIGQAVTIRMAFLQARGALNLEVHARRAILACSLTLVAFVLVLLFLGSGQLAPMLALVVEGDAALPGRVAALLSLTGLTLAAMIPSHMIAALLRARDDVAVPAAVTMASYWGVGLTAMLAMGAYGLGAEGVWLGLLLGASTSCLCSIVYLFGQHGPGLPFAARRHAVPVASST